MLGFPRTAIQYAPPCVRTVRLMATVTHCPFFETELDPEARSDRGLYSLLSVYSPASRVFEVLGAVT